jgi:ribonucleotide reductase alpha subunit
MRNPGIGRCAAWRPDVLNVGHLHNVGFITAKKERGQLNDFNISVRISNTFMLAVDNKKYRRDRPVQ